MKWLRRILLSVILAGSLVQSCMAAGEIIFVPFWDGARAWAHDKVRVEDCHPRVRLDVLDVTIRLKGSSYCVDGVLHFFNTGDSFTERVRFSGVEGHSFKRYGAWANGRKLSYVDIGGQSQQRAGWGGGIHDFFWGPPSRGFGCEKLVRQRIRFPGKELTTIRVSYETIYDLSRSDSEVCFQYGTAAFWKSSIRAAAITVDASAIGGIKNCSDRTYTDPSDMSDWARLVTEDAIRLETLDCKPAYRAALRVRPASEGGRRAR